MNEESLFAAALEKPTGALRRAFLDDACAGDVALRRRVEQLLLAHEKTLGILDQTARPPDWSEVGDFSLSAAARAGERADAVIAGRYRLIAEIGDGGMGTVWKAEQTQPVRRTVALKLIKAGMDSRTVLSRFEAERQALALMEHPNIARVLDAGSTDSGRPFFVMEFVEGVPLTRYCDEACLTVDERLSLFVPVCQAVQHAHTKGVVHRDLKPSNILVCRYDGQPVPKVIDFGLAKAIQQPLVERTLRTAEGVLLGTPLYMSPEQAELNNPDVDARTDIYALGAILYELLTGTTPLERQRYQEAALQELLRLIKEEEPPRPSARLSNSDALPSLAAQRQLEPLRLTRLVRGELDWIVMKCLEKDRSRRYETADGLARDVERYLADESVEACPPSTGYRLRKFVWRNRGLVLAASIIFLLLLAGIAGTTWGLIRAERARKAEVARAEGERRARAQAQKRLQQIEKGSEILASIFRDLDPRSEAKEGRPLRAILGDRLERAAAELEGEAVGDPVVVSELQDRLGRTNLALGHSAKAESLFAKAVAIRRAELGPEDALTLQSLRNQARALEASGRAHEAVTQLRSVRDVQAKRFGADHPDTLLTQSDLALACLRMGKRDEAVVLLEQVRDARTSGLGSDDSLTIATLESLAEAYVGVGKAPEAIKLLEQVRASRVKTLGPGHVDSIVALSNLAFAYQSIGKMTPALALFEEARTVAVTRLGVNHPLTLNILDSVARSFRAFGRTDEAIALAEQVLDARTRELGPYHPHTIQTMENLGLAYKTKGNEQEAVRLFERAVAGLEQLKFVHGSAGRIVGNLCTSLEEAGRLEEAASWRRRWLGVAKDQFGPESAEYAFSLAELGERLLLHEKYADAEPILRECLAIGRKTQPEAWMTYYAQSMLGGALLGQARHADAEPFLVQAFEGLKARQRQIPPLLARHHVAEALGRVVELYDAWGKPQQAAQWRAQLVPAGHAMP